MQHIDGLLDCDQENFFIPRSFDRPIVNAIDRKHEHIQIGDIPFREAPHTIGVVCRCCCMTRHRGYFDILISLCPKDARKNSSPRADNIDYVGWALTFQKCQYIRKRNNESIHVLYSC